MAYPIIALTSVHFYAARRQQLAHLISTGRVDDRQPQFCLGMEGPQVARELGTCSSSASAS
jgi:hypothetical protein